MFVVVLFAGELIVPVVNEDGFEITLAAMKTHPSHIPIQEFGCQVLYNLAQKTINLVCI